MKRIVIGLSMLLLLSMQIACSKGPGPVTAPAEPPAVTSPLPTSPIAANVTPPIIGSMPEVSQDIGAVVPSNVQIKYVGFFPVITKNQAILIAKNYLYSGFNITTDTSPADATVAIFSSQPDPTIIPGTPTVTDLKVWIVVIKQLNAPTALPAPLGNTLRFHRLGVPIHPPQPGQFIVVIDAATGEVIYSIFH